jgi:hypothetical protein
LRAVSEIMALIAAQTTPLIPVTGLASAAQLAAAGAL